MTDGQWDTLEAERGIAPAEDQRDLFDAAMPVVPLSERAMPDGPRTKTPEADQAPAQDPGNWIAETRGNWL